MLRCRSSPLTSLTHAAMNLYQTKYFVCTCGSGKYAVMRPVLCKGWHKLLLSPPLPTFEQLNLHDLGKMNCADAYHPLLDGSSVDGQIMCSLVLIISEFIAERVWFHHRSTQDMRTWCACVYVHEQHAVTEGIQRPCIKGLISND